MTVAQEDKANGDIAIDSGLGDIWLTIPKDFPMDLDVTLEYTRNSRKNFKINTDIYLDLETEESLSWSSGQGTPRKVFRSKAEINGGAHKVKIRTTNGNVYIKYI